VARLGERERVLHLPEDLGLADHHRIEARGDTERMTDGVTLGVGVERRLHRSRVDAAVTAEVAERGGARLARNVGDGVHLDPVAGRQEWRLASQYGMGH